MEQRREHTTSYQRRAELSAGRTLKSKLRRLISTAGAAWQYEEMAFRDHLPPRLRTSAAVAARRLERVKKSVANSSLGRRAAPALRLIRRNYLQVPVTLVLVFCLMAPFLQQAVLAQRYELTSADRQLVGTANSSLDQKLVYDPARQAYFFNKPGLDNAQAVADPSNPLAKLKMMQAQAGGAGKNSKQLYSLELPADLSKGITVYDNNTGLNFKLVPNFSAQPGKIVDGHLVYPIDGGQIVYTLKGNGLKEDIILNKAPKNGMFALSYYLQLPAELAARQLDDGSIGVYSADPSLYGNISFGDSATEQSVMAARKNSPKNNLVFGLPAPSVKQNGSGGSAAARFEFQNDQLQLVAGNLPGTGYPLSIDPSVVVTSTSDFSSGNNEGDIAFNTNQINRGGLTGGTISGGWTATTSMTSASQGGAIATYNGYMYVLAGYYNTSGNCGNSVQYAPINSNGTTGTWGTTTSLPTYICNTSATAYNGYLYLIGLGGSGSNAVYYAPINANGTIGSWVAATNMVTATEGNGVAVYNGYLYVLGGYNSTNGYSNAVQYAPINANGSLGAWLTTSSFTTTRSGLNAWAYNGYMYITGGSQSGGCANFSDTQYAQINANGTLGAWNTTSSLSTAVVGAASTVYNGYVYIFGGITGSCGSTDTAVVQYAQINANGTLGSWATTSSLSSARTNEYAVAYNGYLYVVGGATSNTSVYSDVHYAKIDSAGVAGAWGTTTSWSSTYKRAFFASVAYNGYVYILGGYNGSANIADVEYASIGTNGTLGTWTSTTALTAARSDLGAVAYNGYLYVLGGLNSSSATLTTVQYAAINSNGSLGSSWTTATNSFTTARDDAAVAVYNGYVYVMGGSTNDSNTGVLSDVQYAALGSAGSVGTWTTLSSSAFNTARYYASAVAYGGYLYLTGGTNSSSAQLKDVQFAKINSDGTLLNTLAATGGCPDGSNPTNQTWCTTSAQTDQTDSGDGSLVAANGFLYVIGTWNFSGSYNNVQYAPINANGTIGTWNTSTAYGTARDYSQGIVYNGYLYVLGGNSPGGGATTYNTVEYAPIYNGGSGTAGSWTAASNSFPTNRTYFSSAAYGGYLYVLGGYNSTQGYMNDVQYAALNSSGTIGTWQATTSFSSGRYRFGAVAYRGYLYLMGGSSNGGANYLSDVQYAPLNANGSVGTWVTGPALPSGRYDIAATADNGYLYVLGGASSGGLLSDVEFSPLGSNGLPGAWTSTTALSAGRSKLAAVASGGYVYALGGWDGTNDYNDVRYAVINSNGTLGSWTATSQFGAARTYLGAAVSNGYIYLVGGKDSSNNALNDVEYASINANGSISGWTTTAKTVSYGASAAAASNGYIYALFETPEVEYAPLSSQARVGGYSKVVDLGGTSMISSIAYTGLLQNGLSDISYKVYGASGSTLTASGTAVSVPQPTVTATCSTGGTSGRYVWIHINIDDSLNSSFPDSASSTSGNVQDFTINYTAGGTHPPPTQRLRLGQTLQSGIASALDTCGA